MTVPQVPRPPLSTATPALAPADPSAAAPAPGAAPQPAAITALPVPDPALAPRERRAPWPAAAAHVIGLGPAVPRRGNGLSQWLGLALLRLLGWRIRGYWPDVPKAVVIVAPHTSNMDGVLSVIAMMALRLRLQFFMKHSAFPWPFAGLIQWFGGIPVNRAAAHDLVTASAEQFAAREQLLIAITPDGTRHAPTEWKKGFYWIAHRAQVPILCVGYDYARKEIVILDALQPSGNVAAELPWLQQQFRGIAPKHATRLSAPLRDVNGLR